MNVAELRWLLAQVDGNLEVFLDAVSPDERGCAVARATDVAVQERGDGRKLYIFGGDGEA